MTNANYVIWKNKRVRNACVLDQLIGVEKIFQLKKGVPQGATFPKDAVYTMNDDYRYDTLLIDSLFNTDRLIVAARGLKGFLEVRVLRQVEYLPVTILDHKRRPTGTDHFIVHPIDPVDCLDVDKCGAVWSKIVPDNIREIKTLVIDESKVDPERELFRVKYFYKIVLVRRDLAEAIDREGFTGIRWIELNDYLKPKF